jgi:two-component system LytT family response regulator
MKTIRAVIIDDEKHMRVNLNKIIETHFKHINIVGEGHSFSSAVEVIKEQQPDLIFLDIDLSDGSGFNVLERLENKSFSVIFITAFNEYALKAFRYNALDYLLKPINVTELKDAIKKVSPTEKNQFVTRDELQSVITNMSRPDELKKLVVKSAAGSVYIQINDIIRCEADGSYTTIYLKNGDKTVASKSLKEYETILPKSTFLRIHQSHLINLNFIQQTINEDGGYVVMSDQTRIAIARRRKALLMEKMEHICA